jgi:hypothetical protein
VRTLALAIAATLLASPAAAQQFPARTGESGLLDVPDAELVGVGAALLGAELRFDRPAPGREDFGPFPIYLTGGVLPRIDAGLTMREWGQPGDPVPSRTLFGAAAKLQLVRPHDLVPGFAIDATVDRINRDAVTGGRFIASLRSPGGELRLAGYVGGESGDESGVTYGAAVAAGLFRRVDLVAEAVGGPRGASYGGALRWHAAATLGLSLGFNYLPDDDGWRVNLGFAFGARRARVPARAAAAPPREDADEAAPLVAAYRDDRPRFRLRMALSDPSGTEPRPLRHGPWAAPAVAAASALPAPAPLRAATPSLDDLADAQLRDQEALADARERRVRATAEQLDAREKAALEAARLLEERERELAAREQQLDARDRRLGVRGAPTQQQRDLEALELQLAAQERNLAAQERSFGPAIDAARGRERDAGAREDAERQEASRLAASVSGTASRTQQIEIRRQALGARNRQLAALEAMLVAKGERIDALERQSRAKGERLDTWQRRLDARGERLDLLERRAAEPRPGAGAPPRAAAPAAPAAPADKAVFVMVVKSPTSIVKERAAAPSAAPSGAAIHPGVAVEKAVAAATVVTFATPASQLSELDRETIDSIAKLAAKERCELLIWARAKEPGLMAEAQRRAAEIRTRVMASGPLAERQVVTRITTRPGAQGVDVVVSALRETAKPAAPAAPPPPAPAGAPALQGGEGGKRQIREAVQSAQASIEACVAGMMEQRKLERAEGVLRLTVSTSGKVAKVASEGDLSGTGIAECLGAASGSWVFPHADAEYVVDVPITVLRGGAKR